MEAANNPKESINMKRYEVRAYDWNGNWIPLENHRYDDKDEAVKAASALQYAARNKNAIVAAFDRNAD